MRGIDCVDAAALRAELDAAVDAWLSADQGQPAELMGELVRPLSDLMACRLLGMEPDRSATVGRWSDAFMAVLRGPASLDDVASAWDAADDALGELLLRLVAPDAADRPGVIASLVAERSPAKQPVAVAAAVAQVITGACDAAADLVGNGLVALLEHPDELVKLQADATLTNNAVEETLRWDCPFLFVGRTLPEPLEAERSRSRATNASGCSSPQRAGTNSLRAAARLRHRAARAGSPLVRARFALLPGSGGGATRSDGGFRPTARRAAHRIPARRGPPLG